MRIRDFIRNIFGRHKNLIEIINILCADIERLRLHIGGFNQERKMLLGKVSHATARAEAAEDTSRKALEQMRRYKEAYMEQDEIRGVRELNDELLTRLLAIELQYQEHSAAVMPGRTQVLIQCQISQIHVTANGALRLEESVARRLATCLVKKATKEGHWKIVESTVAKDLLGRLALMDKQAALPDLPPNFSVIDV